jgi:hypothetical protein
MLDGLDRIVIDEWQVVLKREEGFRGLLQRLGKLGSAGTQMVLLTGTLARRAENGLFQRMGWRRDAVLV